MRLRCLWMAAQRRPLAGVLALVIGCPTVVLGAERQLFMAVTDRAGASVAGVTADDVRIEQDGNACMVTSMTPDISGMKVALMVDTSGPAAGSLNPLRAGLAAFLQTLPEEHEVALFTVTGQTQRRVDFTDDREQLREAAEQLFGDSSANAALLDGLVETWERRFDEDDPWPVFVLIVHDGPEASRSVRDREFNQFTAELLARAATVHAVLISTRGGGLQTQVSVSLTENTGGSYRALAAATALPDVLTELATVMATHYDEVKDRYRIVYDCDGDGAGAISVSIARQGVNVSLYADRRQAQ